MLIWLIGAGGMAQDYAKVLDSQGIRYFVVGRGRASAGNFEQATGKRVFCGGVEEALRVHTPPSHAIVAVGVDTLASTAIALIRSGTKQLLVEKPAGLDLVQIKQLAFAACKFNADVKVAFNRRFYSSTREVLRRIERDGGVTSIHFEFTEWSHRIAGLKKSEEVKHHWLLANSSHVIDLAFHIAGKPAEHRGWKSGSLAWHPQGSRFCGAGVTNSGALFSYCADWEAPGRWGIEVMTKVNRFVLRPLENLYIVRHGELDARHCDLNDQLDRNFKPGLYRQTEAFLQDDCGIFCSIDDQIDNAAFCERVIE